MFDFIIDWIKKIINLIVDIAERLCNLVVLLFNIVYGFWEKVILPIVTFFFELIKEVMMYMLCVFFDGFLLVVYTFVSGLSIPSIPFNIALNASHLPTQLIWMLNQIAFSEGLTLIFACIVIRMILNLIPAALTRI